MLAGGVCVCVFRERGGGEQAGRQGLIWVAVPLSDFR